MDFRIPCGFFVSSNSWNNGFYISNLHFEVCMCIYISPYVYIYTYLTIDYLYIYICVVSALSMILEPGEN